MKFPKGENYSRVKNLVEKNHLHTICTSGNCPNIGECWSAGTATFMILGDICTRSCKFCGVKTGKPGAVDMEEPQRLAESIRLLDLKHCVITSVDRDDLEDKGSSLWAHTVKTIKSVNPHITIEALIPDFDGVRENIQRVIGAGPDVLSHNLETIRRLTPQIRSRAKYETSLEVIKYISASGIVSKSGIMVGLGETEIEIYETMDDLLNAGCKVFTIGQYLAPTKDHIPVKEYIPPEIFEKYRKKGLEKGFTFVESGPLIRSSYRAERHVILHKPHNNPLTPFIKGEYPAKNILLHDMGLIAFNEAWQIQEEVLAEKVRIKTENRKLPENSQRSSDNHLILCEHTHVYTTGKSGSENNMLIDKQFLEKINATSVRINRGGDITYHGPGQIVGYPVIDLEEYNIGVKEYVSMLEQTVINTLLDYNISSERLDGATGVWLDTKNKQKSRKICAIGVRVSRSVTMHGFAFNINTDLSYFNHINPCGFTDKSVTSLEKELGKKQDIEEVKIKLLHHFEKVFKVKIYSADH